MNPSANLAGSLTMRWTSSGSLVTGRKPLTTTEPMLRLGTKCPSMTSTWMRSAPPASTSRTSSPSREKSAARMDGAIAGIEKTSRMGFVLRIVQMESAAHPTLGDMPPLAPPSPKRRGGPGGRGFSSCQREPLPPAPSPERGGGASGRMALALALGLSWAAGPLPAQPPDRPAENATAARIADGAEKARAGKLLDAIEQFQRVLDTAGDELVPVDPSWYTPARWVVHGQIARLPAAGLKLYRQRVDGQAAKRLDEVKKARDDAGLHRLLADMFVARASEEAILELARRSFERAVFDAAEHFWRMLLPPLPDDERILRFPDP